MALVLICLSVYIDFGFRRQMHEEQRRIAQTEIMALRARLEAVITINIQTVRGLVASISAKPDLDQKQFERFAAPLFEQSIQIRNIGAAPDMVLSMIHPLADNARAIGLNYLTHPSQRAQAVQARDSGKMVLAGPLTLAQGGQGLVGRLPVYTDSDTAGEAKRFWGLVSTVLDVDRIYETAGLNELAGRYAITLRGRHGTGAAGELFFGNPGALAAQPVRTQVFLPSGEWELSATPLHGWQVNTFELWRIRGINIAVLALILSLLRWLSRISRKKAQSDQRIRALYEMSPIGLALIDVDSGEFIDANPSLRRLLALPDEVAGQPSYLKSDPLFTHCSYADLPDRLAQKYRAGPQEAELTTGRGETVPVRLHASLLRDTGQGTLLWSMVEDMRQTRAAELALQRSRDQFRSLVSNLPGVTYRCAPHYLRQILFVSPQFHALCGLEGAAQSTQAPAPNMLSELIHPLHRQTVHHAISEAIEANSSWSLEYPIVRRDGSIRWVEDKGRQVQDPQSNKAFLDGFILDISDEKALAQQRDYIARQNQELAQLTVHERILHGDLTTAASHLLERASAVLDVERCSIWLLSEQRDALHCLHLHSTLDNQSTSCKMVLRREDYPGYFHHIEQFAHVAADDARNDEVTRELNDIYRRPLNIHATLDARIPGDAGSAGVLCIEHTGGPRPWQRSEIGFAMSLATLFGSLLETDRRRQTEHLLREAKNRAEQADRAKSEFLATMSHEIRTPMNGVLGILNLMRNELPDTRTQQLLDIAHDSAGSLMAVIDDILDFSKIEAGKLELEQIPFSLEALLRNIATTHALRAEAKDLYLLLDTLHLQHDSVIGDPVRVRQILNNLLSNAIKFTERGGITLCAASHFDTDRGVVALELHVIDTGVGLTDRQAANLFQPFVQADSSSSRKYGGTGLGLAIVRRLCEVMDGSVALSSTPGHGSDFRVQLGLRPDTTAAAPGIPVVSAKVLLVGPDTALAQLIARHCTHWQIGFQRCEHIAAACVLLEQDGVQTDCLLLDAVEVSQCPTKLWQQLQQAQARRIILTSTGIQIARAELAGLGRLLDTPFSARSLAAALVGTAGETAPEQRDRDTGGAPLLHGHVLLVEDNEVNQMVAQALLEQLGLSTELVGNGQLALDLLAAPGHRRPDLILMDCQMPVLDGYQTTRRIRSHSAPGYLTDIPIVALTANALKTEQQACFDAGMNDCVTKPVDPDKLLQVLQKWLPRQG
jgi:PAS domain S-box-containing protein